MTITSTDPAWEALKEPGMKIYKAHRGPFRYTATLDGHVVELTATIRGAKRRLAREVRKNAREGSRPFWEAPLVWRKP